MNFATKSRCTRILVWLIWYIALLVFIQPAGLDESSSNPVPLLGVVSQEAEKGSLFPWQAGYRWKKLALKQYRAWRRAYERAKWAARRARLAMNGAVTMAQLVNGLTSRQQHYQVGALPVLYALLETLQVRAIINRHCPTRGEVDHGTVTLVLVLNRLLFPLPLYQVADWVGQTVLATVVGVPAAKFNDDRLGRTLDALYPHLESIWLEVVERAMLKADIDLSLIFYDLTAFIAHGRYAGSEAVDFGFAHNTPMNKRKFKLGLNVTADGNLPWLYQFWPGRTADLATVGHNMNQLAAWLRRCGYPLAETLVVGDRAMLDAEIALAYDQHGLRYLAGLRCLQSQHKALLTVWSDQQFESLPPLTEEGNYWGRGCEVSFKHQGQSVTHKGLVVLAGPLRDQLRQTRCTQLAQLETQLTALSQKLGQPRMRTLKLVQRRVNARLKESPVGKLVGTQVYQTAGGQVHFTWHLDEAALAEAKRGDGRYLLVTNDWSLTHAQMLALYRQKDGVEKRFHVCKSDLQVSPVYLHQDQRIAAMLLLNMLALLAYSLLERQVRQAGWTLTTRQIINRLETLALIETHCHDGSSLRRLTPVAPEVVAILQLVAKVLDELFASPLISKLPLLPTGFSQSPWLPPTVCQC
jgi:transposase